MKQIAIIAGGDSSEYEVSLRSARAVCDSLDKSKFDAEVIHLSSKEWVAECGCRIDKNDFSYLDNQGRKRLFDYALIMIHGTPGENGILQGYFELIGMPYSGCSLEVSALTFNKKLTKQIVSGGKTMGLAREISFRKNDPIDPLSIINSLGLPLFVKPNASGSSCGVTKVKTAEELLPAVHNAFNESQEILIEEFIQGVEISQGIMILNDREYLLPITELVSHKEFFDYEAKYTPGMTDEITPARLSSEIAEKVGKCTLEVYKTLGCTGVVRVDYIVKDGIPYFIEVNTNPGMSNASIVPQQWRQAGLTMGQAWEMIINENL